MAESNLLRHEPCTNPDCTSSDGMAVYDDGHTHCFVCGKTNQAGASSAPALEKKRGGLLTGGEISGITSRGLTQQTCEHFGYFKTKHKGQTVQVAPYYTPEGQLAGQKVRTAKKDFSWRGEMKPHDVLPFGAQSFPRTGKQIVVTEGEVDAMAMSQVQGNRFPCVSIPTGAEPKSVRRYFARHQEYFSGFDRVVLMFDSDEPGRLAAEAAAEVLGTRAAIAHLPLKDAADMLKAGKTKELIDAMWRAKPYRPEGIVDLASLREAVLAPIVPGLSWPFPALTDLTYGIRLGEVYAFGAGTGVGKTDFFTQTMMHLVREHREKVGIFALEQEVRETGLRLMGKLAGKPFHIPDEGWEQADLEKAWDENVQDGRIFLYDSFGVNEWEPIAAKIRYLRDSEDVRYFFLDHLTALAAGSEDERIALDQIMAAMGSLVKEEPIAIFFVSHLATPEGRPHEEGGRVMIRHFRGSRSIGFWSHFMFGLERDQQHENPRFRTTTTFRVLKDRYTGRATGQVFYLGYDQDTGMLFETEPPDEDAESFGFDSEADETPSDF